MKFLRKRVAIGVIFCFVLPSIALGKSADQKISKDTLWSLEYTLPEFLKPWFLRTTDEEYQKGVEAQKLLSGVRFLYTRPIEDFARSNITYENSFEVLPATEEEFQMIKQTEEKYFTKAGEYPFEEKSYNGQTYWRTLLEGRTLMHDSEHAFIIPYEPMVNGIIDVLQGRTPALSQNPRYQKMKNALLWDESLVAFFYDLRAAIEKQAAEDGYEFPPIPAVYSLLAEILQSIGSTFSKIPSGYEWKLKIDQSQEALTKNGLEFTPGGFFTPSLYRKFPNTPVLFYMESNNWKGRVDAWKKFITVLFAAEQSEIDTVIDPTAQAEEIITDIFSDLERDYEMDIRPFFETLQGKIAFAVQDTGFELPVLTAMADVSSNIPVAEKFAEDLGLFIANGFDGEIITHLISRSTVKIGGKDFARFHMNYTGTTDWEGPRDFPSLDVTVGITDDGIFIVSTDPAIATHFGQGLQNNLSFTSAYQNRDAPVLGIMYIGLRNAWNFVDRFIDWRMASKEKGLSDWELTDRRDFEHAIPFSFIRNYLKILEDVYFARDIFIEKNVENEMLTWKAKIFADHVTHETFQQWKTRLSSQDADSDGLSDYAERFIHLTDPDLKDTDGDEVSDGDEVREASDPYGIQVFFRDVWGPDWYGKAVGNLFARGAISGYRDSTFRPFKTITRAEFVCMASRVLDTRLKKFVGIDEPNTWFGGNWTSISFQDVRYEDWYFPCVFEAANRDVISQYISPYFRPHDPITRAEATAIVIRMDEALQKKVNNFPWSWPRVYDLPFKDVPKDAWFYWYIKVAYSESLVQGRSIDTFAPLENMNRAEAAKMLYDGLSRRMRVLEDSKTTPLDDRIRAFYVDFFTSNF